MATPGKSRQSGIPSSGRSSGIPTPGRPRSSSSIYQQVNTSEADDITRAFADAIKANDPAQHRVLPNTIPSLSPATTSALPPSGRCSVAGRSPSVASAPSSAYSGLYERSKTPTSIRPPSRPPSRHSDVLNKMVPRAFEVGDNVRIESLGYEGTLRYVGEIDGKAGLWAGVELSGGFSGKGKNNGSVNGKQYFTCPEKCGVFVGTTKLSAPTVGPGAISRPSSVASSRGRITPSITGRITPSFSTSVSRPSLNGRITPSNGRITPSTSTGRITPAITPSTGSRIRSISRPLATTSASPSVSSKITAGSRASKYVSMTAKQLSSRDIDEDPFEHRHGSRMPPSPSYSSRTLSSPTRSAASPFSTPKPGLANRVPSNIGGLSSPAGKSRSTANTPRARVPSSVAMPPPASPVSAVSRSVSSIDPLHNRENNVVPLTDLQINGKMLQERISQLVTSSRDPSSRPLSSSSISSGDEDRESVEHLRSRLHALEYENERLRKATIDDVFSDATGPQQSQLRVELDEANGRILELQHRLSGIEETVIARDKQVASLEEECIKLSSSLEGEKSSKESDIQVLHKKLEESDVTIQSLQASLQSSKALVNDRNVLLEIKEADFNMLQSIHHKVCSEFEEERRELSALIDELRVAGQETIALYEERLSTTDTQRYDLETRLSVLEGIQMSERTQSPRSSGYLASAQEIDNETLRDQVVHLQKKITTLEDMLEDVRVTSEREEAILRDKIKRLKEKEDSTKRELNEGIKEVERMAKAEATAKNRLEEVEEALRESTVALENARAEVETLRVELANLDGLVGDGTGDLSSKVAAFAQRAVADKTRYEDMVAHLQHQVEELQTKQVENTEQPTDGLRHSQELQITVSNLTKLNEELVEKNEDLQKRLKDTARNMDGALEELDAMRNHTDCNSPITSGIEESVKLPLSKPELSPAREEITGLKHIVQELQKENLSNIQRIKLLESENQLLSSEVDQLRQEVQVLEENLDHSLSQEGNDHVLAASRVGDTKSSDQKLKEQKSRFESELEQLRKRLADVEMKHARIVHDLNKEISELEALVESKIYREDELEQEIERLKEKLTRQKKSLKSSGDVGKSRLSTASSSTTNSDAAGLVCEICERPGHDIFNCDLLKEDAAMGSTEGQTASDSGELFCEDCENHGHVAADCPHSLDVF